MLLIIPGSIFVTYFRGSAAQIYLNLQLCLQYTVKAKTMLHLSILPFTGYGIVFKVSYLCKIRHPLTSLICYCHRWCVLHFWIRVRITIKVNILVLLCLKLGPYPLPWQFWAVHTNVPWLLINLPNTLLFIWSRISEMRIGITMINNAFMWKCSGSMTFPFCKIHRYKTNVQ